MNVLTNNIIKKIIIVLITFIILTNFIMPNYVHAAIEDDLISSFFKLLAWLGDVCLRAMQRMMVGGNSLTTGDGEYAIRYSPGIIFANKVPTLDINFIDPMETIKADTFENAPSNYDEWMDFLNKLEKYEFKELKNWKRIGSVPEEVKGWGLKNAGKLKFYKEVEPNDKVTVSLYIDDSSEWSLFEMFDAKRFGYTTSTERVYICL